MSSAQERTEPAVMVDTGTDPHLTAVSEIDGGGATVVVLTGEIDYDRAPDVRDALLSALGSSPCVVLDLSGVTFCDCSGLNVLLRARLAAGVGRDRRLRVRGMSDQVARLLELTGTLPFFLDGDGPSRPE
ncbi:STAS domain-containing protein [Streptomyces sp. G-G2]|uniref:STAS domain-containing protein n=1 Tax=Streptomyces sp. G-G2 TaxID=3046201 RepID=UPI0024B8819A|nr:STAS domain-containing protein [Streptomyces sp. G-G2]MDJ0386208.1 STAS domain-containing protein [Streptomyces sp. G-G2]